MPLPPTTCCYGIRILFLRSTCTPEAEHCVAISDYLTVIMARNGANKGRKATKKRRKAQQKATGVVKGKKITVTLRQRIHTCCLRKEGKEAYQIKAALHKRYGLELPLSTLSSLYNAKAMKT